MEINRQQKIFFGSCAWSFDDWRGPFYPEHLPQSHWLAHYAHYLSAVEVDSTFYHAPAPHVAGHWMEQAPGRFRFACKMPRAITHDHRLRGCEAELAAFTDALVPLASRLAAVLIQLPPHFAPETDEPALRNFVLRLPPGIPFAIEFRHHGWHTPHIVRLLEKHRICWVWNDISPVEKQNEGVFGFHPQTTDWLYIRLLGDLQTKYDAAGARLHRYGRLLWSRSSALESWAMKIAKHVDECSSLCVFASNHYEGFSPLTCQRLAAQLGIPLPLPENPSAEPPAESPQLDLF